MKIVLCDLYWVMRFELIILQVIIVVFNSIVEMKANRKTKQIEKSLKKSSKKTSSQPSQPQGEPELKSLSDFVTALRPVFFSRPIYTGGRIILNHGKLYASCNQDIAIYDIALKNSLPSIKHNEEEIVNFAVNASGTKIATFSVNGLLRIVDLSSLQVLQITRFGPKFFPNDIAFSQDSRHLAIGFANQTVKIITVESLKQTHSYQHAAPVRHVEWHPSSDMLQLISSDDSKRIQLFDYIANKVIASVEGGHTFSFTKDGNTIVSILNQELRVYETRSLKLLQQCVIGEYIQTLLVVGQQVLFGGEQTGLLMWKMGQERIRNVDRGTDKGVMKILSWQKEKKIVVVSAEQNMTIIDGRTLQSQDVVVGFNDQIIDVKFSKGGESDLMLLLTNSSNAKLVNRVNNSLHCLLESHQQIILCGQYWHPWIATAGKDKTIKLWRLNEASRPRLVANYHGHSDDICGIAYIQKSHLIVSVGEDKTIKIWPMCEAGTDSVQINSALRTIMGHEKTINAVRVSQKEELIATCSHDRSVKVWDKSLGLIFTLTGHKRGVWDAAFHEKQALLVTAGGDGMLKGWSLVDGSCLWSMGQGQGLVRVQWVYEHQVVTGSVDGILKLWDIRKKTSLSYDKHQGKIWALEVRKNEHNKAQIVSGANDSVYIVWADSTEQTRQKILLQGEADEKQRILMQQFRFDKEYLSAAKVAFDGNYRQMFITVLEQLINGGDREITMDEQGNITEEPRQRQQTKISEQISELVTYALQKDQNRLLNMLLSMNSTVRHFRVANRLFLEILKQKKLEGFLKLGKSFNLLQTSDEIGEKQTDFEKFLKNMLLYTEKHHQRVERYYRGSYRLDYLRQLQGETV